MARSVSWRRTVGDTVSWRQDQALNATIYILRQTGPTGFLLKEEGETKKFKVLIGDPHRCSCSIFNKEKDLCKHICWLLLKKFRVPRHNPVTWQMGLVEREINEILHGTLAQQVAQPNHAARKYANIANRMGRDMENRRTVISQREISDDDVCPICQDELLEKHLPVTFCKFGCGNNVHIKCMKVWADHQKSQGKSMIECPFCREDFGPISLLQQEMRNSSQREARAERKNEHLGTNCRKCHLCPISGKCYKCAICVDYHLCQACFNTPTHADHNFVFRQKLHQRWRAAPARSGSALPQAVINNLMSREISDNDYELLLQLDEQSVQQLSDLTEETIHSFPMERVRSNHPLLAPGQQCCICLHGYEEGQFVRRLPCQHKYHRDCIDDWLMHRHPTCPVDGTVFTNESVQQMRESNRARLRRLQHERQQQQQQDSGLVQRLGNVPGHGAVTLEIPGVGIAHLAPSDRQLITSNHSHRQQIQHRNVSDSAEPLVQSCTELNEGETHGRRYSHKIKRAGSEGSVQQAFTDTQMPGVSLAQVIGVNIQLPSGRNSPQNDLEDSIIDFIATDNRQRQITDDSLFENQNFSVNSQGSNSSTGSTRRNRSCDELMEIVSNFSECTSQEIISTPQNGTLLFDPTEQERSTRRESVRRDLGLSHSNPGHDRMMRRVHTQAIRPAGRLSQPSHQLAPSNNNVDININGYTVTREEHISARNFENNITVNPEIIPQPPSIPGRQNSNLHLCIGQSTVGARKPPTGDGSHGNHRQRSRTLHRENQTGLARSRSQENQTNNVQSIQNLYIGSRPSGIAGFNSEFLLSIGKSQSSKKLEKLKKVRSGCLDGKPTIETIGRVDGDISLSGVALINTE